MRMKQVLRKCFERYFLPYPGGSENSRHYLDVLTRVESGGTIQSAGSQQVSNLDSKPVAEWMENDLAAFTTRVRTEWKVLSTQELYDWTRPGFQCMMAVIMRATELFSEVKSRPFPTQFITTLMFLDKFSADGDDEDQESNASKGRFGQVETGEGKSFVVAMFSAALTIPDRFLVDFMTSNKVLAEEQWHEWKAFYSALGLESSNNCDAAADSDIQVRNARYNKASIMYGEISYFERDFLLTIYGGQMIRTRLPTVEAYKKDVVIVADEVGVSCFMYSLSLKCLFIISSSQNGMTQNWRTDIIPEPFSSRSNITSVRNRLHDYR